jgi:exopolysaccharide biosynthesis polyprenyl glycosylphosphotransferase
MHRNLNRALLAITLDILCVVIAVFASAWIRIALPIGRYLPEVTQEIPLLIEALLIYPLMFLMLSLYDPDRPLHEWDAVLALITACAVAGLALAGLVYFSYRDISRLLLVYFFVLHFLLVSAWRVIAFFTEGKERIGRYRRALLVGEGRLALQVIESISISPEKEFEIVGYITDQSCQGATLQQYPCLGSADQILCVANRYLVDDVLIALDAGLQDVTRQIVNELVESSCNVWLVPDYYSMLVYGGKAHSWGGITFISLKAPTLTGYQRLLKRMFDILVGTVLLIISLPMLGIIAWLVRLDSPGNILLKQERVGENRRMFWMYKFRTMTAGSENNIGEEFRIVNGEWTHKTPSDPRVTRVGRFLRRTSMDELPQLWNVLKGEMSLVGPRPELPVLVARYEPWQQKRFAVPQGMTGWWQVNGRSDHPMHLHTEDDLYYVQHYSIWLDIQILLKTLWVVIRGKGAY